MHPAITTSDFADCHVLGHSWRHLGKVGGNHVSPEERGRERFRPPFGAFDWVGIHSQCINCASERVKWMTRGGETINRYLYAEGYLLPRGESISKLEWRQNYVASVFATPRKKGARSA